MSYFNSPHTEEELKDQYRELLSKHDYRDPENLKLMNDIRKEYDETLMKIKRANGYRTPFEKITESAKNYVNREIDEYKSIKAAEKERINKLSNHRYTKEECIENYNNVMYYLKQVIESNVKNSGSNLIIISRINSLDNIGFYQWFNANNYTNIGNLELKNQYDSTREVLEYSIRSISEQTKTNYEKNLLKMEDSLGKFFKEYYRECCDKYVDPIKVAEDERISQQNSKDNAKLAKYGSIYVIFILLFLLCSVLSPGSNLPIVIELFLLLCLAYPIGSAIGKGITKFTKRTTYSTLGAKEQKARVTQKKKYENERAIYQIMRLVRSLLGL